MRSVLIGPGAIGGTLATLITEAGFQLDVVDKDEASAKKLSEEGFHLIGARGEHRVKLHTIPSLEALEGQYDICIIATKYFFMPDLAGKMLPYLKEDSIVVAMQNGICIDMLADVVGKNRAVGCMIGFGATMTALGEVNMTSKGEFIIGMSEGYSSDKLEYFKKMMDSVLPTAITDNIVGALYSKLIINSCINSLGAATGKTLGEVLKHLQARNIFLAIAREGISVAKKMGLKVPPYNGILEYRMLLVSNAAFYNSIVKTLFRLIGSLKYGKVKVSMLQSLERGEKTEIDIFNGYIARKGKEVGVPTPVNDQITQMIKDIETGKRPIAVSNLNDIKL
ncbi:MAG: 2-dehydropantoate 2-reductase [Oscillospiraceae bacterium]|jgi:2-dehydropantoate 2-reductase|nr:2-dehydropantoate 2-reductase [Oscillospiraceae bacterium]